MQSDAVFPHSSIQFSLATSPSAFDEGRLLFREYAASLGFDLGFQDFEGELEQMNTKYSPPTGALITCLIKTQDLNKAPATPAGCVAIRLLTGKQEMLTAELKRLYVRPAYRSLHLGQQLLELALEKATELGYKRIRLDTLPTMKAGIHLYTRYGFYTIPPYYYNPMEDTLYMEKLL